jgi:DNA repair ATPase RecN
VERQELSIVEFENFWKKRGRRFDAIEQQATDFDDRLASYEEMHRSLKQMRTELGELMERLERRITEVSEMQRLGDNRMKHDWSSFQAEDLKRWNTYKLTSDELWREHNRLHDRLTEDLVSISDDLKQATQSISTMTDADRMRLGELMSMMREWLSEYAERED